MEKFLQEAVDFIWGIPLLSFIFIANIYFAYHSKFLPLKGFRHALKLLTVKNDKDLIGEGQISHFQSFCNAIAATVGLGNISGVAIAVTLGGPGAIFWMWIAALFGMNTKFFECTVAQMYRGKDYKNEIQGGAMYVIENALPKKFKVLAVFFAVCGLVGTLSLFQINQLAQFGESYYGISKLASGIFFCCLTSYILFGGLKSISRVCSLIVPFMSVLYFVVAISIVVLNYELLPSVFKKIIGEALNPSAAYGGILGYSFLTILVTGLKRATFSNEAGIGTAPMAHSNSRTSEPISEGYVAMLGPFLDTIIICTLTGIVVLLSFPDGVPNGLKAIEITSYAVENNLGLWGRHFLGITILLFAFSTMIGMANYNLKCWNYLFKGRFIFSEKLFVFLYGLSIFIGALIPLNNVINLMDISYALMTIPNIFATVYLAKEVKNQLNKYNEKHGL